MSLFAALETQQATESKPRRYDQLELVGKGLQRLSYFVESRFVTRGFKNHLKRLGLFNPAYSKQDRRQVYLHRPPVRRFSEDISNRKFKRNWIFTHKSIKGLKDLPRKEVQQQPLHVGTIVHSLGKFFPNPLLDKHERKLVSLPCRQARRFLKKTFMKVLRERRTLQEEPGIYGPGQPPTNPVGRVPQLGSFASKRVVVISNDGKYPTLLGGASFPSEGALLRAWASRTSNFKFFQLPSSKGSLR